MIAPGISVLDCMIVTLLIHWQARVGPPGTSTSVWGRYFRQLKLDKRQPLHLRDPVWLGSWLAFGWLSLVKIVWSSGLWSVCELTPSGWPSQLYSGRLFHCQNYGRYIEQDPAWSQRRTSNLMNLGLTSPVTALSTESITNLLQPHLSLSVSCLQRSRSRQNNFCSDHQGPPRVLTSWPHFVSHFSSLTHASCHNMNLQ